MITTLPQNYQSIYQQTQIGGGEGVVEKLLQDLQIQFPGVRGGGSARNLRRMQMIVSQLNNANLPQLVTELPRGHVNMIFEKVRDMDDRILYLNKVKGGFYAKMLELQSGF